MCHPRMPIISVGVRFSSILLTKMIYIVEYDMMNNPGLFAYTRKARYDPNQSSTMLTRAGENQMCLGSTVKHW